MESKKVESSTPPFKIIQSGKPYYYCEYCICYYSEECFYKNCINRKQRTCSTCYDKFKRTNEVSDSTNRPDDYYRHLLNRLRNCYLTFCKNNRIKDELTIPIIKCVMEAWNHKSILSAENEELTLSRFDLSINGLLEPENLVIYTKREQRRRVHLRIWDLMKKDKRVARIVNKDIISYRKRLRVLLKRDGLIV